MWWGWYKILGVSPFIYIYTKPNIKERKRACGLSRRQAADVTRRIRQEGGTTRLGRSGLARRNGWGRVTLRRGARQATKIESMWGPHVLTNTCSRDTLHGFDMWRPRPTLSFFCFDSFDYRSLSLITNYL